MASFAFAKQSYCAVAELLSGKIIILYFCFFALAILFDGRFLENIVLLKYNPYSIKRYGIVAIVNIAASATFIVFVMLKGSICGSGNGAPQWQW